MRKFHGGTEQQPRSRSVVQYAKGELGKGVDASPQYRFGLTPESDCRPQVDREGDLEGIKAHSISDRRQLSQM